MIQFVDCEIIGGILDAMRHKSVVEFNGTTVRFYSKLGTGFIKLAQPVSDSSVIVDGERVYEIINSSPRNGAVQIVVNDDHTATFTKNSAPFGVSLTTSLITGFDKEAYSIHDEFDRRNRECFSLRFEDIKPSLDKLSRLVGCLPDMDSVAQERFKIDAVYITQRGDRLEVSATDATIASTITTIGELSNCREFFVHPCLFKIADALLKLGTDLDIRFESVAKSKATWVVAEKKNTEIARFEVYFSQDGKFPDLESLYKVKDEIDPQFSSTAIFTVSELLEAIGPIVEMSDKNPVSISTILEFHSNGNADGIELTYVYAKNRTKTKTAAMCVRFKCTAFQKRRICVDVLRLKRVLTSFERNQRVELLTTSDPHAVLVFRLSEQVTLLMPRKW